jgi:hypothetical protein
MEISLPFAVCWYTVLRTWRSLFQFPVVSLEFFYWQSLGSTQSQTQMSTSNTPEAKGSRCVRLTTLPPSCADRVETWKPQGLFRPVQVLPYLVRIFDKNITLVWAVPDINADSATELVSDAVKGTQTWDDSKAWLALNHRYTPGSHGNERHTPPLPSVHSPFSSTQTSVRYELLPNRPACLTSTIISPLRKGQC